MALPEKHRHLEIKRQVPTNPRRPGGGGGAVLQKHSNLQEHAELIESQLQETQQALQQKKPQQFDPGLLLKLRIQSGTLDDKALKSFGIDIVSEENDETLVVFFDDGAKNEFLRRLERFRQGETGHGVSANVFHSIEELGAWTRADRTGRTLKSVEWSDGDNLVIDIELWPRGSLSANQRECTKTVAWIIQQGGEVWDSLAMNSVVLIRTSISGRILRELFELETVRMAELPPVLRVQTTDNTLSLKDLKIVGPADDSGTLIAVLDSGVVPGHPILAPAVGEQTSFIDGKDSIDESGHGTAVAGFALYGDLEKCVKELKFETRLRLLSGRVLLGEDNKYEKKLIANQVKRAVEEFRQLGCKVFNISFGDSEQPYDGRHVKGLAAVLDELAREYDILFVVSAGNFKGTDTIPEHWLKDYPKYLFENPARIIDPAPALNVLTVGSIARYDDGNNACRFPKDVNLQPIARVDEPSPFTRTGPGPNEAIKPEIVEYGGNASINLRGNDGSTLSWEANLGEMSPKHTYAGDRLFTPQWGTSFAAPKVTHLAGRLLSEYPDASANLLRALIVLNSTCPSSASGLFPDGITSATGKKYLVYGYGRPNHEKTIYSFENAVTLIAEEKIGPNQTHFFQIPLPEDFLATTTSARAIRVALAHCPPCRSTRKAYKASKISFKLVLEDNIDMLSARFRSQSQLDNIPEWTGCAPGNRLRSRGTVMATARSIQRFDQRSPLVNGKKLFVVVTHQVQDWGEDLISSEEPYALVVAIEDHERENVRLYTQLRMHLRQRGRAKL